MKILYVSTISNTVNAFLIPHIKMLIEEGHQVDVAFNMIEDVKKELLDLNVKVHNIPFSRSPINKENISAYKLLKNLVIKEKYDIVHTHTPVASAIVRLACKNINKTRVFYTAHGFHFHEGAPLINWLVYYPIEKYLSKYTDTLITINKEDYKRSKAKFRSTHIEYLPGVGIDLKKIHSIKVDKIKKREELNVPNDAFLILSVGELNKNKNHEVVIKALVQLKNSNLHYVICGEGPLNEYLHNLACENGLKERIHLLGFRKDVLEIYQTADVFVFPSLREGLGLSALEALFSGVPIITSNVHGIKDYSFDDVTGYKCNPKIKEEFSKSINKVKCENIAKSTEFIRNRKKLENKYGLESVLNELSNIYR